MKACELTCVRIMVDTRSGLTSLRGCGKDVCCPTLLSTSSSPLLHTPWELRVSQDPDIARDMIALKKDLEENAAGVSSDPPACVRREVGGMLYADDGGIVSKSAEGLAKMMIVIVTVFEAAGLTVSQKAETMLLQTPD